MSTLMSRDLNIERSSTRLHAPPGGKSSFSIAGDYEPVKPKVAAPASVAAAPVEPVVAPVAEPVFHRAAQSSMAGLISQEQGQPRAAVRVRQAPGGASSIVIG
jgi:hypothetical protein